MSQRLPLILLIACASPAALADHSNDHVLETVVVTDTREGKAKKDLPESVSVINKEEAASDATLCP